MQLFSFCFLLDQNKQNIVRVETPALLMARPETWESNGDL